MLGSLFSKVLRRLPRTTLITLSLRELHADLNLIVRTRVHLPEEGRCPV
jgi:hypothetical protein